VAPVVSEDVWSEHDTTPDAIEAALRGLLHERHAANRGLAPARVLNLVVVVDRDWKGEISNRLERVGRYHASRTILCAVEDGRDTLDATVVMSYEEPTDGLGVIRESVEIDIGPEHLGRLDTVVDPVLASELPTVVWAPHGHDEAVETLREMTDVLLIDSDDVLDPGVAFGRAADRLSSAYVVDLAWLRTTPWRERLAAAFDPPDRIGSLYLLRRLAIRHRPSSAASGLLLAGWLASRLHWEPQPLSHDHEGMQGWATRNGDRVEVRLEAAEQDVPGLAGVTVGCGSGFELSLDRGEGGLCATQRSSDRGERIWQVLGASRGEAGILGEGVRQALLRDPTYGPALQAAREFAGDR
jgi:glucose-6-phosphate dehydrogenase assembly protein OpcA